MPLLLEKKFQVTKWFLFSEKDCVKTFNPDVPDFSLQQIISPAGQFTLQSVESASITILVEGKIRVGDSESFESGLVFYQSANETLELQIEEKMVAYRAFVQA